MLQLLLVFMFHSGLVASQQLPAGTHAVDDHSGADAANKQLQAAEANLEKGDYTTAVSLLKTLSLARPKHAQIAYDLGFAEEHTGDEASASEAYARASSLDPTMAEPLVALGLIDARAARSEKAKTELRRAADIKTADPEVRGRALRALAALDESAQPDAARDELLEAVKLNGETADDTALGARLAIRAGDTADAETAYRRAIAADPSNVDAAASLAAILLKAGKQAEAEKVLQTAFSTHPNDPRLITELAALDGQSGKAADGVTLLQQARSANAQLAAAPAATRMLARLQSLAGEDAEAAKLYEGLTNASPADPLLLDEYGGVLVKLARFPEAQAVFTKALAHRDAFPTAQDWAETESHLAFAASRNGNPKLALQALALRATVLPNSPSSLFLQAISFDALHQYGEAVKAYRAFLAVANGKYSDQEFQARHRLVALEHTK